MAADAFYGITPEERHPQQYVHGQQHDSLKPGRLTIQCDSIHRERHSGNGNEFQRVGKDKIHRPADQVRHQDQQRRYEQGYLDGRADRNTHDHCHRVLASEVHCRHHRCADLDELLDRVFAWLNDHNPFAIEDTVYLLKKAS